MKTTICKYCGKQIIEPRKNQLYHPECRLKAAAERQRERRQNSKEDLRLRRLSGQATQKAELGNFRKEQTFYSPVIKDISPPGWSLKGKSRAQVTCEARCLGLTYGQYSAACMSGTIERLLKDRGIVDGQKRIKKAWPPEQKKGEGT